MLANSEIIANFAKEPRDAWCLGGGLTTGNRLAACAARIGRFVKIRKAFTALYSWLLETTKFKDVVEIEAIVNAPWVRLCISSLFQPEIGWDYYIYLLRGVVYHCSFYYIGLWSASKSGMSR